MMQRRRFLQGSAAILLSSQLPPAYAAGKPITRPIPSTGEMLPVMGMGSSRTFDVDLEPAVVEQLTKVMQSFFAGSGTLIDSSPMYGAAETVLGEVLSRLPRKPPLFAATKVWTNGQEAGVEQMRESSQRMGVPVFDLIQVHNLRDWKVHLNTLRDWQAEGLVRYIGITTSHRRNHEELEHIMRTEPIDFVQFSYNIDNRVAEQRLLPVAQNKGIATLINRPFQQGSMFKKTRGKALPPLAAELDCNSWGQFFLKFIIGHPAVTCLIPATAKPHHMEDNMAANFGTVPSEAQRQEMLKIYNAL
jgi:diketogulonate reductase-like aldo/keto reductase